MGYKSTAQKRMFDYLKKEGKIKSQNFDDPDPDWEDQEPMPKDKMAPRYEGEFGHEDEEESDMPAFPVDESNSEIGHMKDNRSTPSQESEESVMERYRPRSRGTPPLMAETNYEAPKERSQNRPSFPSYNDQTRERLPMGRNVEPQDEGQGRQAFVKALRRKRYMG